MLKDIYKPVVFHLVIIIVFSVIYYGLGPKYFAHDFGDDDEHPGGRVDYLDSLYFTSAIQAGVGLSSLHPLRKESKMIVCIQLFLMIATNVILLYLFTI